jgi:hypothetical protein
MTVDDRLVAVQNAAIERALTDDAGARRHLELAGALEVARGEGDDVADETFAAAMCCLVAVAAIPDDPSPPTPLSPPTPGDRGDFLSVGADLAVERYDADRQRLARLAGVSLAAL